MLAVLAGADDAGVAAVDVEIAEMALVAVDGEGEQSSVA